MTRFRILLAAFFFCLWPVLAQQPTASQITISTQPPTARFLVDGQSYTGTAGFLWPVGSKHILQFITDGQSSTQTSPDGSIQYGFGGWKDNAGLLQPSSDAIQTITADPSLTTITTVLSVAYRVSLNYFNAPGGASPPTCGSPGGPPPGVSRPGLVFINGTCYWSSVTLYLQAGPVVLNAIPYPGYVFLGWSANLGPTNAYLRTLNIVGPVEIAPSFSPGKRVTFLTAPLGLDVVIDRATVPTRTMPVTAGSCPPGEALPPPPPSGVAPLCWGDFDFLGGSTHLIGGLSPQRDQLGNAWVFSSWSNGAAQNSIYSVDNSLAVPDTLTATFVRGAQISLLTNPPGLKLNVDGRTNWPSYTFIWGLGETHTVSPVTEQFDSAGRKYVYKSWSNNAGPTQTITVDQNAVNSGFRLIANYLKLSRVVVETTPPGLMVSVDGTNCPTPCTVDRVFGDQFNVSAPRSISAGDGARLDFIKWSDGVNGDHAVTVNADYATLTANYATSYRLTTASNPAGGVTFNLSPPTPDGFYRANTQVTVTANANPGYKFIKWDGDLSGTYNIGTLSMSTPHSVMAILARVPYVGPAGVKNAAGDTPNGAIAPGSIFSIFGQSLAPLVQVGPENPLAQTLAGDTVTVADRILPLMFVSPQQINALLPSDLPNGNYTLLVHSESQPDVSGTFKVVRNSPGLFTNIVNSQAYMVGFHEDGSAITPSSPAKKGEVISVLGTGFGPYTQPLVDGFAAPTPAPALADTLIISAGSLHPQAIWSGAAAGYTGVALTKFKVPSQLPSASSVELKVQINGQSSNTVLLPIQ